MKQTIMLDGNSLDLEGFLSVTRGNAPVGITEAARERVIQSRAVVDGLLAEGRPMYGINTGFGRFADVAIPDDRIQQLQVNLIRADAVGIGSPSPGKPSGESCSCGSIPSSRVSPAPGPSSPRRWPPC